MAPSTLERATLTRRTREQSQNNQHASAEREVPKQTLGQGESGVFWGLVVILLLVAGGNLLLTFFVMGVLRLGYGMESVEFIPGERVTKFFGHTDLGNIYKRDGIIYGYNDFPFAIEGDRSKVSFGLRTKNSPSLEVGPEEIEISGVHSVKVVDPHSNKAVFSTEYPNFGLPSGVQNLRVRKSHTSRVTSPTFKDLNINSDSTIRLKGNEGMKIDGGRMTWSADQDIYIKSVNGSILLEANDGIYVDVNNLPLAGEVDLTKDRGQYKLCVCLPQGQLFRVPVPADNNQRVEERKINCASFLSPCSSI
ncbi:sarcoglycan beta isoform X2 [Oratosquilla oratoria]